ncbi:MAG TPA: aldo/keto reductase [Haloplasmataceae bacterium]
MSILNSSTTLRNGVKMPWLGLGTFKVENGAIAKEAVLKALEVGYRHIDTAKIYGNEESVGQAIKESGIKREEIFLTSKVWNTDQGYEETIQAFYKSLERLETDYLDLYLIHWPKAKNVETWKALEKLYQDKLVRAIGVSNFKIHHIEELMKKTDIIPMVNQVECHPQFPQDELKTYCDNLHIQLEAWAPLMQGKIFNIPIMEKLAEKYHRTIAQIALRWQLQRGVVVIPKSIKANRIIENSQIFDFEIKSEDMELISTLKGERISHDPDLITF